MDKEKLKEDLIALLNNHNLSVFDFLEIVGNDNFWITDNPELSKILKEKSVEQ